MPRSNSDFDTIANEIGPKVRSLQIIHAGLMAGFVTFLGIAVLLGPRFAEHFNTALLFPLGYAAISVVMSFVVPPIVRRARLAEFRGQTQVAADSLVSPFVTGHIVGIALLEGAGFMNGIALVAFGEVPRWFPAVPIAILVLMLIRFPRVASVADWVSMTREEIAL